MAEIEDILTELAYFAQHNDSGVIKTAITNATEQIKAQQREQVENVVKYIKMAKHVLLRVRRTFDTFDIVDIGDSLDAALKELEE